MNKSIIWHIAASICYLLLPGILHPEFSLDFHFVHNIHFQKTFFVSACVLAFFYFHYYFLIPKIYEKSQAVLYVLCLISIAALICTFAIYYLKIFGHHNRHISRTEIDFRGGIRKVPKLKILAEIFQFIPPYLAAIFLSFLIRSRIKLKETTEAKLKSELNLLKSKIDPHFLFNSLNTIYALSLDNSVKTSDAVMNLSEMLRYVLYETSEDKVPLSKELKYIDSYIELNRLRLSNNIQLIYHRQNIGAENEIAPLVLLPFIENVFKHGMDTEKNHILKIEILANDSKIELQTSNPIHLSENLDENRGIGIATTLKRLDLLYNNKYSYTTRKENNNYYLQLIIHLK
ncbi:MAG: histidine kinase [Sphingobacteriaceae bacterium]|nr:histidine kinase [Sphingobacteriaceae bacterium]